MHKIILFQLFKKFDPRGTENFANLCIWENKPKSMTTLSMEALNMIDFTLLESSKI